MPPAIAPPDPGLFSTRNGWPSTSDNFSATMRATTSVPPPAPNPTRMRTGLPGQFSALAALICAHNNATADMTDRQDMPITAYRSQRITTSSVTVKVLANLLRMRRQDQAGLAGGLQRPNGLPAKAGGRSFSPIAAHVRPGQSTTYQYRW